MVWRVYSGHGTADTPHNCQAAASFLKERATETAQPKEGKGHGSGLCRIWGSVPWHRAGPGC